VNFSKAETAARAFLARERVGARMPRHPECRRRSIEQRDFVRRGPAVSFGDKITELGMDIRDLHRAGADRVVQITHITALLVRSVTRVLSPSRGSISLFCGLSAPIAAMKVPDRTSADPRNGACAGVQVTMTSLARAPCGFDRDVDVKTLARDLRGKSFRRGRILVDKKDLADIQR